MYKAIINSLFGITEKALEKSLLKDRRKYQDRILYLKQEFRAEENKHEDKRSHSYMDNIIAELCDIADTVTHTKE